MCIHMHVNDNFTQLNFDLDLFINETIVDYNK